MPVMAEYVWWNLMLRVNWPVVDTIHIESNRFASGVKIKATAEYM